MKHLSAFLPPADSRWQYVGWLLIAAFLLLALVVDKVASTVYAVLFLTGLWLLLRRRTTANDDKYRWLLAAFALYFIVGVVAFFLGEQTRLGEKLMGRDIRFLAAVPVFFAILAIRLPAKALMAGIGTGGVVTGAAALLEVAAADWDTRATGETISILFGHLAAALAAVNLALALHARSRMRWLNAAGALCAFGAVLLSGTRGAALTALIVGVLLIIAVCGRSARRWAAASAVVVLMAAVVAMTPLARHLLDRVADGVEQASDHMQLDNKLAVASTDAVPACLESPDLLRALVSSGNLRIVGDAALQIVEPGFSVENTQCAGGAFLSIDNNGSRHASLVLPERSVSAGSSSVAVVVRGKGSLRFADNSRVERFNFRRPQKLELSADFPGEMPRVVVDVAAQSRLDIVPVVTTPGEYRYPDASGPIVSRLHMWEAALEGVAAAPLLGRGTGAYPELLKERAAAGLGPWQVTQYDHAHNEFLTVAVDRGLFGILALLLLYAVPMYLFHRRHDVFGIAGTALVAAFFLSGLTETIFNHSLAITYYCVLVILLFTATDVRAAPMQSTN